MKGLLLIVALTACACSGPIEEPAPDTDEKLDADGGTADGAATDLNSAPDTSASDLIGCRDCTVFVGRFFDGERFRDGAVSVRGQEIEQVVDAPLGPIHGTEVNLEGTLLPGLFDLHVHMSASGGPYGYFPRQPHYEDHLKAMLRNGVTAGLDLGTQEQFIFEVRRRINDGEIAGPRLYAAGGMFTAPGGHPCQEGAPPSACHLVDEESDIEPAVSGLLEQRPDVLKVIIEGGSEAQPLNRIEASFLDDIVAAAGDLPVIAHVGAAQDVRDALDSGITRFAHVPYSDELTDADIEALLAADAVFVPTLAVSQGLVELATGRLRDPDVLSADVAGEVVDAFANRALTDPLQTESYQTFVEEMHAMTTTNFQKLIAAGVRVTSGTDAGNPNTFHGLAPAREIALYAEHGMAIEDALAAATSKAAAFVGSPAGVIAPGAPADLVVVRGDLSADVDALSDVEAVYLAGVALNRDELRVTSEVPLQSGPQPDGASGDVCLRGGECAEGLACQDWEFVCRDGCSPGFTNTCDTGVCFESGWYDGGYCFLGDGCDLIDQDCENGAACYWLGNGESTCFFAWDSVHGEDCGPSNSCAPGHQCSFQTGKCARLCDPTASAADCPAGTSCFDLSPQAGLTVGECR